MRVQLPGGNSFRLSRARAAAVSVLAVLTVVVLLLTVLGKLPGTGTATGAPAATGAASTSRSGSPSPSTSAPPPAASPVLTPIGATGPLPTGSGLSAALASLFKDKHLGRHVGGAVVDVATGLLLYGHNAQVGFAPASTTKLLTAAAALSTLGPDYRITTKVVAGEGPGQIVLVGGGDPTLSTTAPAGFVPLPASLDDLARSTATALKAAGATTVTLAFDTTLFTGRRAAASWPPTYVSTGVVSPITALSVDEGRVGAIVEGTAPRVPDPPVAAAKAFARRLSALGIKVTGATAAVTAPPAPTTATASGSSTSAGASGTPSGSGGGSPAPRVLVPGTTIASVRSPMLSDLVGWMLSTSDNDLAEAVAHLTALAQGDDPSFEGGIAAVTKAVGDLGLPTTPIKLYDGSGLTGATQVPPAVLAQLLALAASPAHPQLRSLLTGLAVAGFSGSLETRFEDPTTSRAAGLLRGKSGTLTGVSAIAGTVDDADGRVLAFVFLADEVPAGGTLAAREALDQLATAVSACGCH